MVIKVLISGKFMMLNIIMRKGLWNKFKECRKYVINDIENKYIIEKMNC